MTPETAAAVAPAAGTPAADDRRGSVIRVALVAAAVLAGIAFTRWVALPGIPMCAFKLLTGRPCPGCGMTRASVRLFSGDLLEAFRYHPLSIVVGAGAVAVLVGGVRGALTGRDPVWRWIDRHATRLAIGFVAALVVVWIARTFAEPAWAPDPIRPSVFTGR